MGMCHATVTGGGLAADPSQLLLRCDFLRRAMDTTAPREVAGWLDTSVCGPYTRTRAD